MLRKDFKKFLSQTESLTHTQRQRLLHEVKENTISKSVDLIESHFEDVKSCPHCRSGFMWDSLGFMETGFMDIHRSP